MFVKKCNQIKFKIKFKNESDNKFNINENEIKINFILSDENLSKYAILDMLKKNKKDFSILKILFKLNDEYLEIIEKYKEQIIMLINLNIENLFHYLYSSEILRYISKKDMQNKTLMALSNLLIQNKIELVNNNCLENTKINFEMFCFICQDYNTYKKFLSRVRIFSNNYMNYILNEWDKPLNNEIFLTNIEDNIPFICRMLLEKEEEEEKEEKEENNEDSKSKQSKFSENNNEKENILSPKFIIDIINFFFNDFLYLIKPELKNKYDYYRIISTEILSNSDENQRYITKDCKKLKIWLLLMLLHIKIKFGDFNPILLINILKEYNQENELEIFVYYLINLKEDIPPHERIKHFFLTKNVNKEHFNFKFELKNYISNNKEIFKYKKITYFSYFIKKYLNFDTFCDFDYIINSKNEENYYKIFNNEILYFEFLKEDYRTNKVQEMITKIDILKSISKSIYSFYKYPQESEKTYSFEFLFISDENWKNVFFNLFSLLMN